MDEDDWMAELFMVKPRRERVDFKNMKYIKKYSFEELTDHWMTRDGRAIKPADMEDNHITNTIRMIEGICESEDWDPNKYQIYRVLCDEAKLRQRKIRWPGCLITRYIMLVRKERVSDGKPVKKRGKGRPRREETR